MPDLSSQVCFRCRKVFKKPHWYKTAQEPEPKKYRCPDCNQPMVGMGYKFRAPARRDIKEWNRIEEAVKNGVEWGLPTLRKEDRNRSD